MRGVAIVVVMVGFGCGAPRWRAGVARPTVLVVRGQSAIGRLGVGADVVRPDGRRIGGWAGSTESLSHEEAAAAVFAEGWDRGPGEYELAIVWMGDGLRPASAAVPLEIRGNEVAVIAEPYSGPGGNAALRVYVLERAHGIELDVAGDGPAFTIHNRSGRDVRGVGFPPGWFEGWFVRTTPIVQVFPQTDGNCGTMPLEREPLRPGESTEAGPSAWAMGHGRATTGGSGAYVAVIPLDGRDWTMEWLQETGSVTATVTRGRAVVQRFLVP